MPWNRRLEVVHGAAMNMLCVAAVCVQALVGQTATEVPASMGPELVRERQVLFDDLPPQHKVLNPSMVRYHGQTFMIFRRDLKPDWIALETKLAIVPLDEDFQPTQKHHVLDTRITPVAHHAAEDPRAFVYQDTLYVVFNQTPDGSPYGIRRIYLGRIDVDYNAIEGYSFRMAAFSRLDIPGGSLGWRDEKNWIPLVSDDAIRIAYNANPPEVYRVPDDALKALGQSQALVLQPEPFAAQGGTDLWQYGEIRGGTPAIKLDEDHYFAFFHSYLYGLLRVKYRRNYFMGFYAFETRPPYAVTAITTQPVLPPSYTAPQYGDLIIFPGGFFDEGHTLHVTYGICDEAVYVADIDKRKLLSLMTPTAPH